MSRQNGIQGIGSRCASTVIEVYLASAHSIKIHRGRLRVYILHEQITLCRMTNKPKMSVKVLEGIKVCKAQWSFGILADHKKTVKLSTDKLRSRTQITEHKIYQLYRLGDVYLSVDKIMSRAKKDHLFAGSYRSLDRRGTVCLSVAYCPLIIDKGIIIRGYGNTDAGHLLWLTYIVALDPIAIAINIAFLHMVQVISFVISLI